jgi:hypothetical protein
MSVLTSSKKIISPVSTQTRPPVGHWLAKYAYVPGNTHTPKTTNKPTLNYWLIYHDYAREKEEEERKEDYLFWWGKLLAVLCRNRDIPMEQEAPAWILCDPPVTEASPTGVNPTGIPSNCCWLLWYPSVRGEILQQRHWRPTLELIPTDQERNNRRHAKDGRLNVSTTTWANVKINVFWWLHRPPISHCPGHGAKLMQQSKAQDWLGPWMPRTRKHIDRDPVYINADTEKETEMPWKSRSCASRINYSNNNWQNQRHLVMAMDGLP